MMRRSKNIPDDQQPTNGSEGIEPQDLNTLEGVNVNAEVLTDSESSDVTDEADTSESDNGEAQSFGIVKIFASVVAFALLGVGVGLGYSLLSDSAPAPDKTTAVAADPVPIDSKVGDFKPLESDDALRQWNIDAAAYISPLVSQLSRAGRATLGGQIALCQEQSASLVGVLALDLPSNPAVAGAFDDWRTALKNVLDGCVNATPTGDDARDVERIANAVLDTERLFAEFLRIQKPFVDVKFDANPSMFE
jgi:hypothetical protein